jgi:hypothetical protein
MNSSLRSYRISQAQELIGTLRAALVIAAFLFSLALPKPAHAGRLTADTIGLFPKEIGEFAYADLKKARSLPWFPQLQDQMLPDRFKQFEKFLAAAGIDPNSQVEEVAWGLVAEGVTAKTANTGSSAVPTGEQIVGVALGNFNQGNAEAYFKQKKVATFKSHNFTLYALDAAAGPDDLCFVFIDANTAAFGHRKLLERMIEVRSGTEEGLLHNDQFYPLLADANANGGTVWAVLNPAYTRLAIQQLAPEIEQFPDAAKLVTRMRNMIISVEAGNSLDGKFQAICGTTEDANTLAQLMQAGFLFKRYQAQQDGNTDLADLLDRARVTPAGDRVSLSLTLNNAQVASLIQHNTFAFKM